MLTNNSNNNGKEEKDGFEDGSASASGNGAVILSSHIKEQLRLIIPRASGSDVGAGVGIGVGEGDILCRVKGFVAACRGVDTRNVLEDNFPGELEVVEVINGRNRYFLRDIVVHEPAPEVEPEPERKPAAEPEREPVAEPKALGFKIDENGSSNANSNSNTVKLEPDRVESSYYYSYSSYHATNYQKRQPGPTTTTTRSILRANTIVKNVKQEPQEQHNHHEQQHELGHDSTEHAEGEKKEIDAAVKAFLENENEKGNAHNSSKHSLAAPEDEDEQIQNAKKRRFRSKLWKDVMESVPKHGNKIQIGNNHDIMTEGANISLTSNNEKGDSINNIVSTSSVQEDASGGKHLATAVAAEGQAAMEENSIIVPSLTSDESDTKRTSLEQTKMTCQKTIIPAISGVSDTHLDHWIFNPPEGAANTIQQRNSNPFVATTTEGEKLVSTASTVARQRIPDESTGFCCKRGYTVTPIQRNSQTFGANGGCKNVNIDEQRALDLPAADGFSCNINIPHQAVDGTNGTAVIQGSSIPAEARGGKVIVDEPLHHKDASTLIHQRTLDGPTGFSRKRGYDDVAPIHVTPIQRNPKTFRASGEYKHINSTATIGGKRRVDWSSTEFQISDETKALIISLLPKKGEGREGICMNSITRVMKKNNCLMLMGRAKFEACMRDHIEIELSGKRGNLKRYFRKSKPQLGEEEDLNLHDRKQNSEISDGHCMGGGLSSDDISAASSISFSPRIAGLGRGRGISNQPAWMTRQQAQAGPSGISCGVLDQSNVTSIQDDSHDQRQNCEISDHHSVRGSLSSNNISVASSNSLLPRFAGLGRGRGISNRPAWMTRQQAQAGPSGISRGDLDQTHVTSIQDNSHDQRQNSEVIDSHCVGGGLSSNNISVASSNSLLPRIAGLGRGRGISNQPAWMTRQQAPAGSSGISCGVLDQSNVISMQGSSNSAKARGENRIANGPVHERVRAASTTASEDTNERANHCRLVQCEKRAKRPTKERQMPTLSDETKEMLLSLLPKKETNRGVSMSYINENFNLLKDKRRVETKTPTRAIFEANMSEHIEIEYSGKKGNIRRYFLRSKPGCGDKSQVCAHKQNSEISGQPVVGGGLSSHSGNVSSSPSLSDTACLGRGRGISNRPAQMTRQQASERPSGISCNILNQTSKRGNDVINIQGSSSSAEASGREMIANEPVDEKAKAASTTTNSLESEIVALIQKNKQKRIEVSKLKYQYWAKYRKELCHEGRLQPFLAKITGVMVVKRKGKPIFVTLNDQIHGNNKPFAKEAKATSNITQFNRSMVVGNSTTVQGATASTSNKDELKDLEDHNHRQNSEISDHPCVGDDLSFNNISTQVNSSLPDTDCLESGHEISNEPAHMSQQQATDGPDAFSRNISSNRVKEGNDVTPIEGSDSVGVNGGNEANSQERNGAVGSLTAETSVESQIMALILKEKGKRIQLSQLKVDFKTSYGKNLVHEGKLRSFLELMAGVKLVSNEKKSKGKGKTVLWYITLDKKRLGKDKLLTQESNATTKTTSLDENMVVKNRATTHEKALMQETMVVKKKVAAVEEMVAQEAKATTTTSSFDGSMLVEKETATCNTYKIKELLKLTPDQAPTCTKFPPGCRVVYDYQEKGVHPNNHAGAQICTGRVDSVHISLSHATRGQLKHRIEVSQGFILVDEEYLAYSPQSLVCYQSIEKDEPATILSCHKNDDGKFVYSILVDGPGQGVFDMKHNVGVEDLSYCGASSLAHDLSQKQSKEEADCHTSQMLSIEQASKKRPIDVSGGKGNYHKRARI